MAKVTKDMGILDIVQQYPETIAVFQKYGMGCIGCAAARFENLEAGAKVHGFNPDEMVDEINSVIGEQNGCLAGSFYNRNRISYIRNLYAQYVFS